MNIGHLLKKESLNREDILQLLQTKGKDMELLFQRSKQIKQEFVGRKVYLRGLIELSNICCKNCFYCGIRQDNHEISRYQITEQEWKETIELAIKRRFTSLVIQSGELTQEDFIKRIIHYLTMIRKESRDSMRVTLSLGEQTEATYRKWFMAGAHRYLLRIETSNPELYQRIHPENKFHNFENRIQCLKILQEIGYQTGTGVMIGLPFQTLEDLANDLLFFRANNIDMVGMGPYIEHPDTPLFQYRHLIPPAEERFALSLKMIAILRIMMKNINIAAATAMQTLNKTGREKALQVGANVWMPNITPGKYRKNYLLYPDKPCINENAEDCLPCLEARVQMIGDKIAWEEPGDSLHYLHRMGKL